MRLPPVGAVDGGNAAAEICVIGRCDFATGIGAMTYAACEMLSRAFPTCILPTEPSRRADAAVFLPNGRRMPVCRDLGGMKVTLFCDVLWNGAHDTNYLLAPQHGLRIAWIVFDSDTLPAMWVDILNHRFDLVLVTSPHLLEAATRSGVESPTACMPIPLDLAPALAQPPPRRDPAFIRFGSVAAFHPRKGVAAVVEAFLGAFAGRADASLMLHSNLAFGDTAERVRALVADLGGSNVTLSHATLASADKDALIRQVDVFVNCSRGEAYSIGPREALAAGCALVLSDVGGHADLRGVPGVFMAPAETVVPARYPEIDNLVFGRQRAASVAAIRQALWDARAFAGSPAFAETVHARRQAAAQWSFDALAPPFAALLDPALPLFRPAAPGPAGAGPEQVIVTEAAAAIVTQRLGRRADRLQHANRVVQLAHDGGFFSIFNAFVSHAVWAQRDGRCHAVLPDWNVGRMIAALGTARMTSFCYGQPGDGNIWCRLFEPVFGFTAAELDDPAVLYRRAVRPAFVHNEQREPQMTYVHAYKLYNSRDFAAWRRQYHAWFARHIRLRPHLQAAVDGFAAAHFAGRFVIGAHVRHPSHTIEQPGAAIAREDAYIARIRGALAARGIAEAGTDWTVFLATDQERVVTRFRREFGARVACLDGVRRTRPAEDAAYDRLAGGEQGADGHQLQHLVAADRDAWSVAMAEEVVRDAWLMARCSMLLHVVSNVSTAVSYMNPGLEMVFCQAA